MADFEDASHDVVRDVRELKESRERVTNRPGQGDRGSGVLLGGSAVGVAIVLAARAPAIGPGQWMLIATLCVAYGLAFSVELELPGGGAVPTQPVLVGLLLAGPPALAPLAVLLAVQGAGLWADRARARPAADALLAALVRSHTTWVAIAPALVLVVTDPKAPSFEHLPVYSLALGCQFAADIAVALVRSWSLGLRPRKVVRAVLWTCSVDVIFASLALCVVISAAGGAAPLVVLLAPVVLVKLLAFDRAEQLRTAMSLGAAFDVAADQARTDPLTGLANRRAWDEALLDQPPDGGSLMVLMADLDGLKRVNDTEGHDAGDELIMAMAHCLSAALPDARLIARLGGDEFGALILSDWPGEIDGEGVTDRLRHVIGNSRQVRGHRLSSSLGWASTPPHDTLADAVSWADEAARRDKVVRKAGRAWREASVLLTDQDEGSSDSSEARLPGDAQ